jgi:hypothetical protein
MNYRQYLKSSWWQQKRIQILERDKYQCTICSSKEDLQVHHKNYNNLWQELDSDLITLCKGCHQKVFEDEVVITSSNKLFTKLFKLPDFSVTNYTSYFCALLPYLEANTNRIVKRTINGNIPLTSNDLEKLLNISYTSLYRFMKECYAKKYIVKSNNSYYVSPIYAIKGKGTYIDTCLLFGETLISTLTNSNRDKISNY